MSTQVSDLTIERRKWAHVIGIRSNRLEDGKPPDGLSTRIRRVMTYLQDRWLRTHPDCMVGYVRLNISRHDNFFIRDQIGVVGSWFVLEGVPESHRDALKYKIDEPDFAHVYLLRQIPGSQEYGIREKTDEEMVI